MSLYTVVSFEEWNALCRAEAQEAERAARSYTVRHIYPRHEASFALAQLFSAEKYYPFTDKNGTPKKPSELSEEDRENLIFLRIPLDETKLSLADYKVLQDESLPKELVQQPALFLSRARLKRHAARSDLAGGDEATRLNDKRASAQRVLANFSGETVDIADYLYSTITKYKPGQAAREKVVDDFDRKTKSFKKYVRTLPKRLDVFHRKVDLLKEFGAPCLYLISSKTLPKSAQELDIAEQLIRSSEHSNANMMAFEVVKNEAYLGLIQRQLIHSPIGGHLWSECQKKGIHVHLANFPDASIAATFYMPNLSVQINAQTNVPIVDKAVTLAHELAHADRFVTFMQLNLQCTGPLELFHQRLTEGHAFTIGEMVRQQLLGKNPSTRFAYDMFMHHTDESGLILTHYDPRMIRYIYGLEKRNQWQTFAAFCPILTADHLQNYLTIPGGPTYCPLDRVPRVIQNLTARNIEPLKPYALDRLLPAKRPDQGRRAFGGFTAAYDS